MLEISVSGKTKVKSFYKVILMRNLKIKKVTIKLVTAFLLLLSVNSKSQCNVALNKPATASGSIGASVPAKAFDGISTFSTNAWTTPTYTGSIQVDLQGSFTINTINLFVDQTPNGNTTHQVYKAPNIAGPWTLVETITGFTSQGQLLVRNYLSAPLLNVGAVKITTTSSPSWVSWREIEIFSPISNSTSISSSGPLTFCQGGSVVLTSSSSTGNIWSTGATTQSITVTNAGTYSVTAINGSCSSSSAPKVVTINPNPATPTITAVGSTTFCQGGSVVLTSSSVNGNTWSNNAVTQSVTIFNGGSYNVSVSNGTCSSVSSNTIVTVNPLPTVTLNSLNNFININANLTSLNGSPTGGVYSGPGVTGTMFNPQIAGLGNSLITYSYTNSSGCIGSANQSTIVYDTTGVVCTTYDTITTNISVIDTLIINTTITGLTPPNNLTSIKVFPNPTSDHITINYGNYAAIIGYTLKITNALGQIVFTTPINQQTSYVDLSTWSGNGIYFLQIFDLQNNIIENRKIVLQ